MLRRGTILGNLSDKEKEYLSINILLKKTHTHTHIFYNKKKLHLGNLSERGEQENFI